MSENCYFLFPTLKFLNLRRRLIVLCTVCTVQYCTVKHMDTKKPTVTLSYLSDDCQLVTEVGRRHLGSSDVYTCAVAWTVTDQ